MSRPSVVCFGYGELALAALEVLGRVDFDLLAVIVPSNRSGPDVDLVLECARNRGYKVLVQPPRRTIESFEQQLRSLQADLFLVWSYSMILPASLIQMPRLGAINVHGGLLPEYRGAHVMQWAIINGEKETGVTLHRIEEGIDTGAVIARSSFPIEESDDAASVRANLKKHGVSLLERWLPAIVEGTASYTPQDTSRAHYYPLRAADDGRIDWTAPRESIRNLVRALVSPWPGAFTLLDGHLLIIRRVSPVPGSASGHRPGSILKAGADGIRVVCGDGLLALEEWEDGNGVHWKTGSPPPLLREGNVLGT